MKRVVTIVAVTAAIVTSTPYAGAADWDDLPPVKVDKNDWPWWRGPTHDGKAHPAQKPPVKWSKTESIVWQSKVPGRGHGSPAIWGERIFLATALKETEEQVMLCYDRTTGKKLWQKTVHKGGFMKMHKKNSQASGTPACDGERVFISFMCKDATWMTALSLSGNTVWQERLGDFKSIHGYVGSPIIYKSSVIINCDTPTGSFITCRHRKTGKEIWRAKRAEHHSFSSPAIGNCCGRDQLVVVGANKVESYDPMTGKHLWSCDGPSDVGATTATISDDMIFAAGGYPKRALLAIKGDGKGDVTGSHLAWKVTKEAAYVTSLLLHDGLLHMIHDNSGTLRVFEPKTGKEVLNQKLSGECSSSPMLAGGNIYQVDEKGVMNVFKPGAKYVEVARNDLGNGGFASPAFCDNRIYLRTLNNLYCIGDK
ncbi:MAG: PQQ-binding-like beta-propeller repeat protein [Kiritimatiellia bacterium]|jgi:hypothetical protein|nr:PQQ-binding-like beta-propeller repeat protein [Kiritimatiellia bacterium]